MLVVMGKRPGLKGLQGLTKWNQLSDKEKKIFFEDNPQFKGKSVSEISQIYDNSQYVAEMGEESFYAHPDKAERDSLLKKTLVQRAKDEYIKPYESLSDDENKDMMEKIRGLSDDGFLELVDSGFKFQPQVSGLDKLFSKEKEEERAITEKEGSSNKFIDNTLKGIASKLPFVSSSPQARVTKAGKETLDAVLKENKDLLDTAVGKDLNRAKGSASELSNYLYSQYDNMSTEDFNKEFSKIYDGEKVSIGFGDDKVEYETSGIGVYKNFKEHHELDNLSRSEKQKMLADYYAVAQMYGPQTASLMANNDMQNYIHNHQTAWDWWGSALRGATGKTIASFGQLAGGLEAFEETIRRSAVHGSEAADEWLFNFMQGKDENGNDRAAINNLTYWNGVDQYGVIPLWDDVFGKGSATKIREITENGGISPYNWLSEAGNEMNLSSAANEGLKMLGYIAAQTLTARGIGKIGGKIAGATGGVFDTASGLYDAAQSTRTANIIMKYATPGVVSAINAIPISVGYAKGSFDEVYRQATERADYEAERWAADAMEAVNSEINESIGLGKNGFYVTDEAKMPHKYSDIADELNVWAVNKYKELVNNGADPSQIDMASIYNQALSEYKQYKNIKLVNQFKENPLYEAMMQSARREAASAYERNATIEWLRMCGVNYLFKQYQQDKSVRAAMNANYPNLGAKDVGNTLEKTGKIFGQNINPKVARWIPTAKTIWGGFESNYMDDVTAAYAKGFSIGRYNDYVDQLVGNPNSSAATISWAAGITSALAEAEGAFYDKQSWYDGFIGALGSGMVAFPGSATRAAMSKSGREGLGAKFRYSNSQMARIANKYGLSLEEYINGEFEKYVERNNNGLTDAQVKEKANELRAKDGLEAAVKDGRVQEVSFTEKLNKIVYNPLLSQYEEAAERERAFDEIIRGGNKAIAESGQALEDLIRMAIVSNDKAASDESDSMFEGKEVKARRAFALVSMLARWMEDPVLSQSEFVQKSWSDIERMAKEGGITDADIQGFLLNTENRSEASRGDAVKFAKERLKSNAEQLLKMRDAYQQAVNDVKKSKDYRVIASHNAVNDVVETLAFDRAMNDNREARVSDIVKELGLSNYASREVDIFAEYGSIQGAKDAIALIKDQRENLYNRQKKLRALISKKRDKETFRSLNSLRRRGYELELKGVLREINSSVQRESSIRKAIEAAGTEEKVLSAEEILSKNAYQIAQMLDDKNTRLYSEEQRAEIRRAKQELLSRNPDALEKVQDLAKLQEAIDATAESSMIMQENLQDAADYYEYARQRRAANVEDALIMHHYREVENAIDNADGFLQKVTYAKTLSVPMIDRYMKEHPDSGLGQAKDLAKLGQDIDVALTTSLLEEQAEISKRIRKDGKADTEEDVARKKEEMQLKSAIATSIREAILGKTDKTGRIVEPGLYYDRHTYADTQLMGLIEDLADRTEDPNVKSMYERLLTNLEKMKHQRDATVVQERKAKEAEAEKREAYEKSQDGKNFGWEGYKVGDTVYHKDGRKGSVRSFVPASDGETVGSMKVHWEKSPANSVVIYTGKEAQAAISKEAPVKSSPQETADMEGVTDDLSKVKENPSTNTEAEEVTGDTLLSPDATFTDDGGYLAPSETEELETAVSESEDAPFEVKDGFALDEANKKDETKNYREGEGLLEGNGLYEYDVDKLRSFGIEERRTTKKEDDRLSNFFKWLDQEHIQLQEIIDRVFSRVYQANPDVKIQFMMSSDPLTSQQVLQVIEFTSDVEKVYNEVNDSMSEKLGGVIVATDGNEEKRYLVVGTTYSHIGKAAYYRIFGPLADERSNAQKYFKSNPSAKYFVYPMKPAPNKPNQRTMYTKVAKMDAGRLISRQKGETENVTRTLGELFEDPSRNPDGISFDNAIMGIMYNDKFFLPNRTVPNMFPPGKSDATLGRVFLMIKAANGNYIPVAVNTDVALNSSELRQGALTDRIDIWLDQMTSKDVNERRRAVVELGKILKFEKSNHQVTTGFLVGTESNNSITLVWNGSDIKTWSLENFDRADFINTVKSMPFKINVTQQVLQSPARLREYDEAGVFTTDVSTLRTGNVAYQIFPVDADGNPIKVEVRKAVPQSRKLGVSKSDVSTTIAGKRYSLIDGDYYDRARQRVTDPDLRRSIYYNLVIQRNSLQPVYKSSQTGNSYYVIVNNLDVPVVVSRDSDGNVRVLSEERAVKLMELVNERKAIEERRKNAAEELKRIEEGKREVDGEELEVKGEEPAPTPQHQPKKEFIEPRHDDNVTYGPAIRTTKIHSKWDRKDINVELHIKTTVNNMGEVSTEIVGWDENGSEWAIPLNAKDVEFLQVPDGYAIPQSFLEGKEFLGFTKLIQYGEGKIEGYAYYKEGFSYSHGWVTLDNTAIPKSQQIQERKEQKPAESKEAPKSDFDPNKATTKSLEELQKEAENPTFDMLFVEREDEFAEMGLPEDVDEAWSVIEGKFRDKGRTDLPPREAISDVETFIQNLKSCY